MAKPPAPAKPKTALEGLWETFTDFTPWGTELDTSAVPDTGQARTRRAPSIGWWEAAKNAALNILDPRQAWRQFKNTVSAIPSLFNGDIMRTLQNAGLGAEMEARIKRGDPVDVKWYRSQLIPWGITGAPVQSLSDQQIKKMMERSTKTWNIFANDFSYVDPKTKQRRLDLYEVGHKMMTNPRDVITLFAGAGEIAASKRLANLARPGRIGGEAGNLISNTGKLATRVRDVSRATNYVADPFTNLAVRGGSKAIVRAVDIAKRSNTPVTSILNPDFVTAFESFKDNAYTDLVNLGKKPAEARRWVRENRDRLWYEFNEKTGGQYRNPYNDQVTAMFQAQGKNPEAFGAPSIYDRLNQRFNRTGGPNEAALRQVTLESAQVPNPRRSATTLEAAPPVIAQNDKNWIATQQQALSTGLDQRMSSKYPGQQFDFGALSTHNPNPVAGSQISGYTFDPAIGWQSASGIRAGDVMQPILTDQYRLANATPGNIDIADLDFIQRNRAAASDLGATDAATQIPPVSVWNTIGRFGRAVVAPVTSGVSTAWMTGSPHLGAVVAAGAAGRDLWRAGKSAKSYLEELSGSPFNYNPNNPFLTNNSGSSRFSVQAPALLPYPQIAPPPPPPPPPPQQPKTAVAAPQAETLGGPQNILLTDPNSIKLPDLPTESSNPTALPSVISPPQELQPERYDLRQFGIGVEPSETQGSPQYRGGRIAYKKGGAVGSTIEHLVQGLMSRYKTVKKSQDNGTKPLLEQPDQAIVKALSVAQKAI